MTVTIPAAPTSPEARLESPPASTEVVVRRDHRRTYRSVAIALAACAVLVFWVPALIVVIRREPGYFTAGIVWTALIATVVLAVAGFAATSLWLRTGDRATPLLVLSREGIRIPARHRRAELDAPWTDLALVRVIGAREPELAVYLKPEDLPEPEPEAVELDLSEPEFLRPLDFENNPPPPMRAPEREVFTEISAVPEVEESVATDEPRRPRLESLYATPHVVSLSRTTPELREVLRTIRRYADGRVPLA